MPGDGAELFRTAQLQQVVDAGDSSASLARPPGLPSLVAPENAPAQSSEEHIPASASAPDDEHLAATPTRAATHTVRAGESLWQIARRYSVGVKQLRQWNHLRDGRIRPGQKLKVSAGR